MANKLYEETHIQTIADAIREKNGSNKTYSVSEMADGVREVYEGAASVERDAFWDMIQDYGKRIGYHYGFSRWSWEYASPKYKVVPKSWTTIGIFQGCTYLKNIDKDKFDLSQLTYYPNSSINPAYSLCEYCSALEVFPDIGLQAGYYGATFTDNLKLHTIEILRFAEDTGTGSTTFRNCKSLVNLTVDGVIGRNFPISAAPLSTESFKSIITHLKDYTGTDKEYSYTLTINATAFATLEAEGATAEYNGVACTWTELIDNLKWNLVKS